jgi:hypothetical protein
MYKNTVTIWGLLVTYKLVSNWMNGFIDTLDTQLGISGKSTAISSLLTLQVTVTYALGFSVFTSRILATEL